MLHASCLCCRKCTGTVLQRSAAAVGHLSLCAASRGGGEETAKIRTRFNLLRSMFHFSSVRWECVQSWYFFWICRGLLKLISNCNTHLPGSLQCSVLAVTVYNWLRLLHILDAVTDFSLTLPVRFVLRQFGIYLRLLLLFSFARKKQK